MPCPAKELGAIAPLKVRRVPFSECDVVRWPRSDGLRLNGNAQARVPVLLKSKSAPGSGFCTAGLWPAFLNLFFECGVAATTKTEIQRRRPEASGTKSNGEKKEVACEPSIESRA